MGVAVTVRDVPEETRDELASRAAASGQSLQEYLKNLLIELAHRPDAAQLTARVRERKRRTGSVLPPETILEHLGADRR